MTTADALERHDPGHDDSDAGEGADGAGARPREILTFSLGDARFGVWVDEVLEVLRTPPITRLPLATPEVAGITSVRGVVVPVLDLGERLLGRPAARPGRIVLVRHHGSGSTVGLLVDGLGTLLSAAPDALLDPPPEAEAQLPPGYVSAVLPAEAGVVTVLDIGEAAAPPETATEG